MALNVSDAILAILKTWYKDGVENLLFRNSPVLKEIEKVKVEGKEQAFAALYGRGGAVAGDATVAETKAKENVRNAEFKVTPGQLFSMFAFNAKEVQASLSKRGAYMKVAGNKAFAAAEALRKSLAAAFYGRGYGEIGTITTTDAVSLVSGTPATITLSPDAILKIDVGSGIVFKTSIAATSAAAAANVTAIDGETVTIVPTASATLSASTTYVVALAGSMDASGNALLPMGIDGWLPVVNGRENTAWTNYIGTPFFNVTRSVNPEALAGNFVVGKSGEKKYDTITRAMQKARRRGSLMDMIILNDQDWLDVANEIQSTNTYFTQTSTKAGRKANVGFNALSAGFSTNFIDVIYDDPYCPKGKFYVLDKSGIEFWLYTNAEIATSDGVAGNEPGKEDPEAFNNKGNEDSPFKLLIDDVLTVVPGGLTTDGDSVRATYNLFGSFVVTDPASQAVGLFYNADGYTGVLGY